MVKEGLAVLNRGQIFISDYKSKYCQYAAPPTFHVSIGKLNIAGTTISRSCVYDQLTLNFVLNG